MTETAKEQIKTLTQEPYKYAINIEYDREVVTVRLYNLWENKTQEFESAVTDDCSELVDKIYKNVIKELPNE